MNAPERDRDQIDNLIRQEEGSPQVWHVYPIVEKGLHEFRVDECGCPGLRCVGPCPECLALEDPNPECWKCGGDGVVDVEVDTRPLLVVHGYFDDVGGYLGDFFSPKDPPEPTEAW